MSIENISPDADAHELEVTPDPEALRVQDFDLRGAVFIIPSDAPIPSELADVELPTGTLYERLAQLANGPAGEFGFAPLSGTELLALDRAWRSLQGAQRVFALYDLPGAKYDILFTQAARQIGIARVEWPSLAEAISSRVRIVQRTRDTKPWNMKPTGAQDTAKPARFPQSSTGSSARLPVPEVAPDEDL